MKFFDSLILDAERFISSFPKKEFSKTDPWHDSGQNQVIMRRDTAFELEGVGFNLVTSDNVSDGIVLVGEGKPMDEIAAGIQLAVAKRCFVMAKKAGATDSITLTGGCAKNDGLKKAIEKVLKIKVVELSTDPQLMGALGAAEYARQKGLDK